MKNFDYKNEAGRSMIEMLGVLAIIGVLSVGGIAGYSKAMMKYRINKTIEQITLIAGNVRAFFAPQRSYAGLDSTSDDDTINCIITKAKLIPDEMLTTSPHETCGKTIDDITGAFGESISVYSFTKATDGDNKAFSMSFSGSNLKGGIPDEACIELISQDWTNANVDAIMIINSNEQEVYKKTPVDVETAVNLCNKYFTLNFYFDIDTNSTYWRNKLNPS